MMNKLWRGFGHRTVLSYAIFSCVIIALSGNYASAQETKFNCDRACLTAMGDLYFKALAANNASILPVAAKVKYTETGVVTKLGDSFWKRVTGLPSYRFDIIDPATGGLGVHAIVPEGDLLTMLSLRLKVINNKITEIETIIIPEDTNIVGATPRDQVDPSRFWTRLIPKPEQNSRFELLAAADSYFRAFTTNGKPEYVRASLTPDTIRYENGMKTTLIARGDNPPVTTSSGFDAGRYQGAVVSDRRYPVVDIEKGIVMSIVRFGKAADPLTPPPLPPHIKPEAGLKVGAAFVSEVFAITQGKIVEIEAYWIPTRGKVLTPWPLGSVPIDTTSSW